MSFRYGASILDSSMDQPRIFEMILFILTLQARWQNRRRREGWLPPSLMSRIANILTWVGRLSKLCKITNISLELVKFDMQLLENPELEGVEYQQGTLAGYETREYLLEKWGRKCA